jgi:GTP-binding protein
MTDDNEMAKATKMPVVAIVGRPNVGKSSLLNALVGMLVSIVQDMPGVTRDRVSMPMKLRDRYIELVDTGGYGFVDPDQLTDHIQHQIEMALARSDVVMFVVDANEGLTTTDQEIAGLLRKRGLKTILVANKVDGKKEDAALGDFARLGLGTPIGVSAKSGRNIEALVESLAEVVDLSDAPTEMPPPAMMVAIVGKRNAGKSTLVNAIARLYDADADRVIVSEVPGTTRDSIDVRFEKDGEVLVVIDTAGVRKKRRIVASDVEYYSFHRAQRSIRRADVVMLLVDGTEILSEPDKKLARYVADQFKPVVIIVNKWDLTRKILAQKKGLAGTQEVDDAALMEEFGTYLGEEMRPIDFAPIAFVTAKDGRNVQAALDMAKHLFKQASQRLSTGMLNRTVRQVIQERSPSNPVGRKARVYYVTQAAICPPTIVLFVNNVKYLSETYRRYIVNRFRDLLPYPEVPIKLMVRGRQARPAGGKGHVPGASRASLDEMSEEAINTAGEGEDVEREEDGGEGAED